MPKAQYNYHPMDAWQGVWPADAPEGDRRPRSPARIAKRIRWIDRQLSPRWESLLLEALRIADDRNRSLSEREAALHRARQADQTLRTLRQARAELLLALPADHKTAA